MFVFVLHCEFKQPVKLCRSKKNRFGKPLNIVAQYAVLNTVVPGSNPARNGIMADAVYMPFISCAKANFFEYWRVWVKTCLTGLKY
jgi:hypothetical protein